MQTVLKDHSSDAVSGQIRVAVEVVRTIYEINICKWNFLLVGGGRSPRSQLDSRKEGGRQRGEAAAGGRGFKPRGRRADRK